MSSSVSYSTNHLVLYSNILSKDVTSKHVSSKLTTAKQFHSDSTIHQEKMSSTFISDHPIIDVNTSSTNSLSIKQAETNKVSLASFASSSILDDRYASTFSMTNNSPYSKHYFASVILQSSTHELKSRPLIESSLQTILPSSQKFSTNSVDRISTLIVSVSSPNHTTIYSSSLRSTKAATLNPKIGTTTSFIVLRRTTTFVSPIISTSDKDPTSGSRSESTLKNWMKDNMLLVLGISIGIAVVLVVVVIILIVRRKKSNKPPARPELDPSDLFSNRRVTLLLGPDDELMPDMQPAVTHSNPLYSSEFVERQHSNYTGNRDSHFC
ncbi:uncharacterized protein LOC134710005 [Mytilus trossulus]|uniref:uncharacterized protein LOC134710005 n=1 Tax=Mytilus trossulus TaxID=6551 RepID=UPI00300564D7